MSQDIELKQKELENKESSHFKLGNKKSQENNDDISNNILSDPPKQLDFIDFSDSKENDNHLTVERDDNISTDFGLFNRKKEYFFCRLGNTYAFWFNKMDEPRIVIGPHWPFYICLISVITLMSYSILYLGLANANEYVKLIGWIIYLLQILFYTLTFLINPGLPSRSMSFLNYESKELPTGVKICNKCGIVIDRKEKTYHCDDCEICIIGYDHHCPWTSKCIGKGNLMCFYLFVSFTMILFGYLIFSVSFFNIKDN